MIKQSRKMVKAAKQHKCIGCGLPIHPGTRHVHDKWFDKDEGHWVNRRFHSTTCEFDFIVTQNEYNERCDIIEAQHDENDCIYTTPAIHPLTEDIPQYEDDYCDPWA